MRISRIDLWHVRVPLPAPFFPSWIPGHRQAENRFDLIRLTTRSGIEGWSAAPAMCRERRGLGALLGPYFLGERADDIANVRQRIREMGRLALPTRPGLGFEIDRAALRCHGSRFFTATNVRVAVRAVLDRGLAEARALGAARRRRLAQREVELAKMGDPAMETLAALAPLSESGASRGQPPGGSPD